METDEENRHEGDAQGGENQEAEVKSNTIVRYPTREILVPYSRLDINTNLHQPPPNWLRNGPTIQIPNTWVRGEPAEISSFGMADAEILDDVDVISASENIKTLLKIPFSNDQVSLAVHRIGKTLLLDKLDLYKHLRHASQGERKWLQDYFIRLVQEEGEKKFRGQHKTTERQQSSNLLSKFLYHSLGNDILPQSGFDVGERDESQKSNLATAIQQLPAAPEDEVSQFARQVFWHFEDIRMLIGTDLPIFGGGTYPAVSLRLRDDQSPINVLTGLDYWLDNLMCNVPELVMCYHLDGVVQRYELLKTEEIPTLENAQFSQKVVKDIAQNILSFIKSNCTKEGHTYWLFKGQGDEVVKLYDLSSLMTKHPDCPWDNPFIIPVATLLYRVAHNMAHTAKISAEEKHIIVKLLDKCLSLLSQCRDQHPDIVAQANYILCQMYMDDSSDTHHHSDVRSPQGASVWTGSDTSSEVDDDRINDDTDDDNDDDAQRQDIALPPISTQNLMKPSNKSFNRKDGDRKRSKVKLLKASKAEKARQTLEYVVNGLTVIKANLPASDTGHHSSAPSSPSHGAIPLSLPPSMEQPAPRSSSNAIPLQDKPRVSGGTDPASHPSGAKGTRGKTSKRRDEEGSAGGEASMFIGESGSTGDGPSVASGVGGSHIGARSKGSRSRSEEHAKGDSRTGERSAKGQDLGREKGEGEGETSDSGVASGTIQGGEGAAAPISKVPSCCDLVLTNGGSPTATRSKAVAKERPLPPGSWQETSGLLLLEKAFQAYSLLMKLAWEDHRHGRTLINGHLAIKCLNACRQLSDGDSKLVDLLMMCGDSHLLLTHNPGNQHLHHEDYQNLTDTDTFILEAAVIQQASNDYEWATEFQTETEDCLECSIRCYRACNVQLEGAPTVGSLKRSIAQKLGNACNELGVFFMNTAANLASVKESMPSTFEQELWKESFKNFDAGIKSFEGVSDTTNVALLRCNMGRLMRLCAQSYSAGGSMGPKAEFSKQERHYYIKAAECYSRALSNLGSKTSPTALWDSITWELCSTHFNMACLLQDQPPVSTATLAEIEKDVLDAMSKALALCDTEETSSSRQPLYQYRAATIHHRLASMYHNSNRNQSADTKRKKHTRSLSDLHYTKSVRLFRELDRPVELLRVELERVALLEHQFEGQTSRGPRVRTLESALGILLDCSSVIPQLESLSYKLVPSDAPFNPGGSPNTRLGGKSNGKGSKSGRSGGGEASEASSKESSEASVDQRVSGVSTDGGLPGVKGSKNVSTGGDESSGSSSKGSLEASVDQRVSGVSSDGGLPDVKGSKNVSIGGDESSGSSSKGSSEASVDSCVSNILKDGGLLGMEASKDGAGLAGKERGHGEAEGEGKAKGDNSALETARKDAGHLGSPVTKGDARTDDGAGGDGGSSGVGSDEGDGKTASGGPGEELGSKTEKDNDGEGKNEGGAEGEASGGKGQKDETEEDSGSKSEVEEVKRLLEIFESRLQFVLLNLVKLMLGGTRNKSQEKDLSKFKQMYAASLGKRPSSSDSDKGSLSLRLEDITKISDSSR